MPEPYAPYLIAELRQHGVTEYELDDSGKHYKLRFNWQGQNLMHVFPRSPSDTRGVLNCLSDLRRQMNVKRVVHKSSTKTTRRRNHTEAHRDLTITVKADPFAALAALKETIKCPEMSLSEIARMLNLLPR